MSTLTRFKKLTALTYSEQAKWFLNAYWPTTFAKSPANREHIFTAFKNCAALDDDARKGHSLSPQWKAHQFLEKTDGAVTWEKFKARFRAMDLDIDNRLSLIEYLLFKFDGDVAFLVNAPQKIMPGLIAAETALEEAREAYAEAQAQKKAAQLIHAEIKAFKDKFDKITKKLEGDIEAATSVVKRGTAKAELGAHLSGARARRKKITALDPELLHTLEIKQGAAVRKQKAAFKRARRALKAAEKQVALLRASATAGEGLMWWLERELADAKKTMSQKDFARKQRKLKKKRSTLTGGANTKLASRRSSLTSSSA